jgi:hypothetical protein
MVGLLKGPWAVRSLPSYAAANLPAIRGRFPKTIGAAPGPRLRRALPSLRPWKNTNERRVQPTRRCGQVLASQKAAEKNLLRVGVGRMVKTGSPSGVGDGVVMGWRLSLRMTGRKEFPVRYAPTRTRLIFICPAICHRLQPG